MKYSSNYRERRKSTRRQVNRNHLGCYPYSPSRSSPRSIRRSSMVRVLEPSHCFGLWKISDDTNQMYSISILELSEKKHKRMVHSRYFPRSHRRSLLLC
jgi:hypothetical protein